MKKNVVLFILLLLSSNVFSELLKPTQVPTIYVTPKKITSYTATSAPKDIISKQDISRTGVISLSQALAELGGLQVQDSIGAGSPVLLSMRGFGVNANSNTLVLINGIPINNPDLAAPDLNSIPLQEVEYVEVINGSEGVLYGDQAVGGLINIITPAVTQKKIEITCNAGSYLSRQCFASAQNHTRYVDYNIGVMSNHTDNYRQNNNYDQTLLTGKLSHAYQTGMTSFDYKLINERMQYPGALTAAQVRANRRQANNNTDFFKDWNGLFHFKQQQNLNENWKLDADLARRELHGSGVLTSPFHQSRYITYFKPVFKGTYKNFITTNGINVEADRYNLTTLFGVNDDALKKYALFTIWEIPATEKLQFSIGARGAQQDSHLSGTADTINRAFAETIGATYQVNSAIKIYLRRAGSFRFPNADEIASVTAGNPPLKTQRGVSYESGVQLNTATHKAKLSVYQLNLVDEIAFDPLQTPQQPFGSNTNLDPTGRYGFSLAEKYQLTSKIAINGQYNYVNARFRSGIYNGKRIPLVAENLFRGGCDYHFADHWNLYSEAIYTGNQYADNDNANIAGLIGGYTLFNLNLRFEYQQFSASFRVNNIFNKKYYFYTVFLPSMDSEFFYPAPERNVMLTMKYDFL